MSRLRSHRLLLCCLLVLSLGVAPATLAADALWSSRPYRVEISLDLTDSGLSAAQQARLRNRLLDRLNNRLGRFWRVDFASDAVTPPTDGQPFPAFDKRLVGSVELADGSRRHIRTREHDLTLDHWGPAETSRATGVERLDESLYEAVTNAFRPLARFRRDPESPGRVTLDYLGADLAPESGPGGVAEDQLLIPFTRRLRRGGEPAPESAKPVRWTYLVAEAPGPAPGARVVSHSKRSLAGRAGGRVERFALAAPDDDGTVTELRLHSLSDPETPLPGYEVLYGGPGRGTATSLGFSDARGVVRIPRGERVAYAHIRCGGLFVASLPVAPGVDQLVEVPLIDERSRLRAELEITSIQELLIDTAARRQILAQRIRRAIDDARVDLAVKLLSEIDSLPGRTRFNREIDQVERQAPANHPSAKKRLDKLFTSTRQLVTSALDPRELRDLTLAVDQAKRGEGPSGEESTPES